MNLDLEISPETGFLVRPIFVRGHSDQAITDIPATPVGTAVQGAFKALPCLEAIIAPRCRSACTLEC